MNELKIKISDKSDDENIFIKFTSGNIVFWVFPFLTTDFIFLFIPEYFYEFLKGFGVSISIILIILFYMIPYLLLFLVSFILFREQPLIIISRKGVKISDRSIITKLKWKADHLFFNYSQPIRFQTRKRNLYLNIDGKFKKIWTRWPNDEKGMKHLTRILNTVLNNMQVALAEQIKCKDYFESKIEKPIVSLNEGIMSRYNTDKVIWKGKPHEKYMKRSVQIGLMILLPILIIFILFLVFFNDIRILYFILEESFSEIATVVLITSIMYLIISPIVIIPLIHDLTLRLLHWKSIYLITESKIIFIRGNTITELPFSEINHLEMGRGWLEDRYGNGLIGSIKFSKKPSIKTKNKYKLLGVLDHELLRNLIYKKVARILEEEGFA